MDAEEAQKFTFVVITAVILGIILLYFIISLIRHQRRNIKLNQEKVEAEILALENERKRIAADLHDELGPTLSGIKLILSGMGAKSEEEKNILNKVNRHIDTTISRMRQISNNLMPKVIEKRNIDQVLETLINEANKYYSLNIEYRFDKDIDLTAEQKLHLYRVFQEILHNTIKHSEADNLTVELIDNKNKIILQTQDNGKGFDLNDIQKHKKGGLGLRNLQSRTEVLEGEIDILSKPGQGTKITINIPYQINGY